MENEWFFLKEAHSLSGLPADNIPEYIFWGRSNVGKSSLINLLIKKKLAKTSKTPGRTKSLVFFQFKKIFRIVDFPGYGFSYISKEKIIKLDNLIEGYLKKRENIKKIFLLFDSRHLIKPIDKVIIESLLEIQTNEINFIFTKVDKIKSLEKKKINEKIKNISKDFNKNIFHTSIKESNGIILLRKFLYKSLDKKVG
ncbi:MAG: YihA family ribosome biogenesis GTP-binding protein [Alphaproteobacteria bacterium]|nr:YihA family ribosome biogenesis GTP-binding protein [Alphaproteobacteria bacterium]